LAAIRDANGPAAEVIAETVAEAPAEAAAV
jgi:hypothetical protein